LFKKGELLMIGRNDPCWCGSGKKWKKCHYPLPSSQTEFEQLKERYLRQYQIVLKTEEQIEGIRRACRLTAEILAATCARAAEGVTTNELDRFAHQLHLDAGARPAPLGFGNPPFPKSICTSLNEVICHGIPDDRPLEAGDIMNIDVSLELNGYYGDTSRMVVIGQTTPERQRVVETSRECLERAIRVCRPGALICEIGEAIESYATSQGCSVVDQFVGHGVGLGFHEPPQIPHHRNHLRIPMVGGMIFTIEPMINAGKREAVLDPFDGWTARTIDGLASAQWEHQLLITNDGCEILTRLRGEVETVGA
jgi:methionyl aminopeptidase